MSHIIETGQGYVSLEHIVNRFTTDINEARCFISEGEAKYHAETRSLLDWMIVPRFAHTLAALDIHAAKSPERAKLWDINNIKTDADVAAAEDLDKEHAGLVQEAFFQDTKGLNCRDNCGLMAVQDLKRISGWKKS